MQRRNSQPRVYAPDLAMPRRETRKPRPQTRKGRHTLVSPYLIPCLVELRSEFNDENPNRHKDSDGWIGDTAHQQQGSSSDHNPDSQGRVLAIDVTSSGPWPNGTNFQDYIDTIVTRCRQGLENRLQYVIYNRHIWRLNGGWAKENYDGDDPHTNHGHFSARHDHTGERNTSPWHIEDASMPSAEEIAQAVAIKLDQDLRNPDSGLYKDMENQRKQMIADLWSDLHRGPGDPAGQSGLNKIFRGMIDDEVAKQLAAWKPPTTTS